MRNPFSHLNRINWRSRRTLSILGGILALFIIIALTHFLGKDEVPVTTDATPTVRVSRVAELMNGGSSLSVIAEITSVSEAKISPESGGKVTKVRASLGDSVTAGQILAEVENSSQRAVVLQAEGSLDAAKAALKKLQGGTRDEQLSILQTANASARAGAVNTLLSAYASFENALRDDIDVTLRNPNTTSPTFIVLTSQSQLASELQNSRPPLNVILARETSQATTLSVSADLKAELTTTETELRTLRASLDLLIRALNNAIPNDDVTASEIAGYLAGANAARTAVTGSLSAISSARSAIETSEKNLEQGVEGAQSEDIAATEASVKQAQGAYNAALANLEKTILRTPISGTLNNFTVKLGDTVSPSQQIAIVSNNGALEALAYVTEEDTARISVGKKVTLEGEITGTITRIAPALDPVTRRIEVRIGLPANAKGLTNGQSVRVELANETGASTATTGPIAIPISALRMEAARTIVFVVENGKLVSKEIKIGRLSGDSVQVSEGLSMDTEIVVDARGRKEGETVEITHN